MTRITNITRTILEKRLRLTPEQEEALKNLEDAFDDVFNNGMGVKEIAVVLQDVGPTVPAQVIQWQPFAFAALYFDDELFSAFTNGDKWAVEEAAFSSRKVLEQHKSG